jgi:hypothetical protein
MDQEIFMKVRIRYEESMGQLVTKKTYVLPTGQVVLGIILMPYEEQKGFLVKITEYDREKEHYTTEVDTLKDAKKVVKAALSALGVEFGKEVRAKRFEKIEEDIIKDAIQDTL